MCARVKFEKYKKYSTFSRKIPWSKIKTIIYYRLDIISILASLYSICIVLPIKLYFVLVSLIYNKSD